MAYLRVSEKAKMVQSIASRDGSISLAPEPLLGRQRLLRCICNDISSIFCSNPNAKYALTVIVKSLLPLFQLLFRKDSLRSNLIIPHKLRFFFILI